MRNRSTFFSLLLETLERSGTGAERAKNLVSWSGAVSGCEKIGWSGSGAGARGRGAGNGSGSGSVRNRFERREEILPLPLRSHALIRQLCCSRPYLDSTTACTIVTSIVHSKFDYCNSLYYNLPKSPITRLQQIQNFLTCAVVKAPKSCHITPILRSLQWLKITERVDNKLLSLTYKVLTTTQPPYLHNRISDKPPRSTRSSFPVTIARPPTSSSLRITDRCFRYLSRLRYEAQNWVGQKQLPPIGPRRGQTRSFRRLWQYALV